MKRICIKNKAFTLIELLAVIVILAILALIAIPIILNIIKDVKDSANKRSIELYGKAVEGAIARYQLTNNNIPTFNELSIEYDGARVKCETNIINKDGTVYLADCMVGNNSVDYTYGEPMILLLNGEPGEIGSKYSIKVNNTDRFNFYILSINTNENDEIISYNLIMDRNICEDGTANYTEENNYCTYAWHYGDNNNSYGPDTAMTKLYQATNNWIYVEDMVINYTDKNNFGGYESIITSNGVTTIIGKNGNTKLTIESSNKRLKSRLPMKIELETVNCDTTALSCPYWLVDNLKYESSDPYSYSINNLNTTENILYIEGYWTLNTWPSTYSVWYIKYQGRIDGTSTYQSGPIGIRPVITIPVGDLLN